MRNRVADSTSAAFRTNVVNLALLLARAAEPGGRLSNEDVSRQLTRIAATAGDKGQLFASLEEISRAVKLNFQNRRMPTGAFIKNLPEIPDELKSGKETPAQEQKSQTEDLKASSHPVGTQAKTSDGRTLVVKEIDGEKVWVPVK